MNQIVYILKNESMPEYVKKGTLYFEYEDEILDDRRRRMDESEPSEKKIDAAGDAWMQQQADIERGK